MAKLKDLSDDIREALNVYQFYRQLGFTSDQIFAGVDGGIIFVVVRWRGLEFSIGAAKWGTAEDDFEGAWADAADVANSASEEEIKESWYASKILANAPAALMSMVEKGIYWPNHENFRNLN